MPIKNFLDKFKETEDDEYIELGVEHDPHTAHEKIMVHIEHVADVMDADRIQKKVRDGHILLVKIKDLREKDVSELKRAVEKIKRTCTAINGDIAGIGEDWIIVTPATARVHREHVDI